MTKTSKGTVVYILILPGNFGDLEAYGGVYSTAKKAQKAAGKGRKGIWDERTYTYGSGGRFWMYRDNSDSAWSSDAAIVREVEVE